MKPAHAVFACILLMIGAVFSHGGQQDAAPAVSPSNDAIDRLVLELGDPDFATREAASQRLREIGKAALPALKEAASDPDPEIRSRAEGLVRRIERRPLPGGPLDRGRRRVVQRLAFSDRKITVDEEDRQFEIVKEEDGGIRITVTAVEDGKPVIETYSARSEAELREQEPEAYAVFERWGNAAAGGGAIEIRAGQIVFDNRVVGMGVRDEIDLLRERLEEQMREGRVAAAQVRDVLSQLDKLQAARQGGLAGIPAEPGRQIKEYFRLSDLLRKKLAELKLDAGDDALPPPPNQRLGVQITMEADPFTGDIKGLLVQMVVGDSRAAKIGVKAADLIRRINDRPIRSTRDIREALGQAKDALVVEVVRDGKTIKLTEQADQK